MKIADGKPALPILAEWSQRKELLEGREKFHRLITLDREGLVAIKLGCSAIREQRGYSMPKDVKEMSEQEIRERVLLLGFDGDERLMMAFRKRLEAELPEGTGVALRGSVVTNKRWQDGKPFDAEGKGTSDLDVTLIGTKVMEYWNEDGYYIPGLHTKPLRDQDPQIAVGLNPLRNALQELVRRPVNFQATANLVLYARDVLFDEPYFVLTEAGDDS